MAIASHHMVLVKRYIQYINQVRPDIKPVKNKDGSLELSHALWMLHKMSQSDFVNKTSDDAWITWIQASLFSCGILNVRNEIDITRDILNQHSRTIVE
jgi:hypothetical protein